MNRIRWLDFLVAFLFTVLVIIFDYFVIWQDMPEFRLWKSVDFPLLLNQPQVTIFHVIHLILGLALLLPATYNVLEVIRVNQSAHAGKNNPLFLLTDGFYQNVRHPMIGMFILMTLGVFFTFCSLLALIIALSLIGFLHLSIIYEERARLIPRFGAEYIDYMKRVPGRYYNTFQVWFLGAVLIFAFIGVLL